MVLTFTILLGVPVAPTAPLSINRTFEEALGTTAGSQLPELFQFVSAVKPFVPFQTLCAPAGRADEMTAATIASDKGFNRIRIFFTRMMGLVISMVDLIGLVWVCPAFQIQFQ